MFKLDVNPLDAVVKTLNKLYPEFEVDIKIYPESVYAEIIQELIELKSFSEYVPCVYLTSNNGYNVIALDAALSLEEMLVQICRKSVMVITDKQENVSDSERNEILVKIFNALDEYFQTQTEQEQNKTPSTAFYENICGVN